MSTMKITTSITDTGEQVTITAPSDSVQCDGNMVVAFVAFGGYDDEGEEVFVPYVAVSDRSPRTRSAVENLLSGVSVAGSTGRSSYTAASSSEAIKKGSRAIRRAAINGAKRGFLWGVAIQVGIELVKQIYHHSQASIPEYYMSPNGPDLDAPVYLR